MDLMKQILLESSANCTQVSLSVYTYSKKLGIGLGKKPSMLFENIIHVAYTIQRDIS